MGITIFRGQQLTITVLRKNYKTEDSVQAKSISCSFLWLVLSCYVGSLWCNSKSIRCTTMHMLYLLLLFSFKVPSICCHKFLTSHRIFTKKNHATKVHTNMNNIRNFLAANFRRFFQVCQHYCQFLLDYSQWRNRYSLL